MITLFFCFATVQQNRLLDPVIHGDYPAKMRELVGNRLPTFTEEQKTLIKGSTDFIGVNYYRSFFAKDEPNKFVIDNLDNYDALATKQCKFLLQIHSDYCLHYKRKQTPISLP